MISSWSSRKCVCVIPSGSKIFFVVNSRSDIPLTRWTMIPSNVKPVLLYMYLSPGVKSKVRCRTTTDMTSSSVIRSCGFASPPTPAKTIDLEGRWCDGADGGE